MFCRQNRHKKILMTVFEGSQRVCKIAALNTTVLYNHRLLGGCIKTFETTGLPQSMHLPVLGQYIEYKS